MIKMNEKYAQNLEHIVAERTSLLVEAQEQTNRLLCEMLPPFVLFAKHIIILHEVIKNFFAIFFFPKS